VARVADGDRERDRADDEQGRNADPPKTAAKAG
jgi:hypothetical protein